MPSPKEYLLRLERCPHCSVHKPTLTLATAADANTSKGEYLVTWAIYICKNCCMPVTIGSSKHGDLLMQRYWPKAEQVDENLPASAKKFLNEAIESVHSPAASIMVSASSVDAMLREKDYKEGSLYTRIDQAAEDHLITDGMRQWAHKVRLEANTQRHPDDNYIHPTPEEAKMVIEFAKALGQFMFVLPALVEAGIEDASSKGASSKEPTYKKPPIGDTGPCK